MTTDTLTTTDQATTSIAGLARILNAVLPFTTTDSHPVLGTVRLEAGDGFLAATTTNRYVAAHARTTAVGMLAPVNIAGTAAQKVVDVLKPFLDPDLAIHLNAHPESPAVLCRHGGVLHVDAGALRAKPPVDEDSGANWPDLTALFAAAPTVDTSNLVGPIGLDLRWLKTIADLDTQREWNGLWNGFRLSFDGPKGAIRVELGDWFTALVMPLGHCDGKPWASLPTVPFGIAKAG